MEVRRADRGDLLGVARVVHAAHWETYTGLLKPQTIAEVIATLYRPSVLKRRLMAGELYVALDDREVVVAFGIVDFHADHTDIPALAVDPEARYRGVARTMIDHIRGDGGDLPLSMTVLLGSLEGEAFAERLGFVPGETIEQELAGEEVVQRRWWLAHDVELGSS